MYARIRAAMFTLLALSGGIVSALGSASAPSTDCVQTLISLSKCLAYVMAGSNATDPDVSCCVALQDVAAKDEQMGSQKGAACLCDAMNNRPGLGVQLNDSKVFTLPNACVPGIPPVANCSHRIPSAVPPRAPPPEAVSAGISAFGSTDSSSLVALTAVALGFFIF